MKNRVKGKILQVGFILPKWKGILIKDWHVDGGYVWDDSLEPSVGVIGIEIKDDSEFYIGGYSKEECIAMMKAQHSRWKIWWMTIRNYFT